MKNYKSLVLAAIVLAGSLFASCSKEGYWKESAEVGAGYSLPAATLSYTFAPNDDMTKVQIPIVRSNSQNEATLIVNATTKSPDYVDLPESVEFAAGQKEAYYVISILKAFDLGKSITVDLSFDKVRASTAGIASASVTIMLDYTWTSLGIAKYKDGFFWNLDGYVESEIFQCDQDASIFKLADPYTKQNKEENLNQAGVSADSFFQFKVLENGETYGGVSNAQKGWIYYKDYCTGVYDGGSIYYLYHPSRLRGYESYIPGACVTEFQENGLPATVDLGAFILDQNGSGWLPASDRHVIVFPNVPILDQKVSVKYTGRTISTTDEEFVNATISLGKDLDFGRVVLVEGKDPNVAIPLILSGAEGVIETAESGEIKLPIVNPTADQTYCIVAAGFVNGEGDKAEAVGFVYTSFKYVAHGASAPEWELVGVGDFTYNSCIFTEDEEGTIPYVDEGLELYRFPGSNTYKITGWCYDADCIFTIEDDGTVIAEEGLDTGIGAADTGYAAVLADDGSYWGVPSGYVGQDGSINIYLVYYFDDGNYTLICHGLEKFVLNAESTGSTAKPVGNFKAREDNDGLRFCNTLNSASNFRKAEKESFKF